MPNSTVGFSRCKRYGAETIELQRNYACSGRRQLQPVAALLHLGRGIWFVSVTRRRVVKDNVYVICNIHTSVYIRRFPCELSSFRSEAGYRQPGFEGNSLSFLISLKMENEAPP